MMLLLLSGISVEVASVSLVLKEPQSDAVELKHLVQTVTTASYDSFRVVTDLWFICAICTK